MTHTGATSEMKQMFFHRASLVRQRMAALPGKVLFAIGSIPVVGPVIIAVIFVVVSIPFVIRYTSYVARLQSMEVGDFKT